MRPTQLPFVHGPQAAPQSRNLQSSSDSPETPATRAPVLLYDGDCGFCARSVQFVLAQETVRTGYRLRFAPLQGALGLHVAAQFPAVATANSVVWFEPLGDSAPRALIRSDAALSVLAYLGGAWRVLAWLGRAVPRPLRVLAAKRRRTPALPALSAIVEVVKCAGEHAAGSSESVLALAIHDPPRRFTVLQRGQAFNEAGDCARGCREARDVWRDHDTSIGPER